MSNLVRIEKLSRKFRAAFLIVLVLIPLIYALSWVFVDSIPDFAKSMKLPFPITNGLPRQAKILGFLVSLLPMSINMLRMWILVKLFKLYGEGKIFTIDNVQCYRRFGYLLIAEAISNPIYHSLLSIALTLHYPPGQKMLSIGLGSDDAGKALMGGIVLVISWVMEEGRKLETEQALTV